MHTRIHPLIYFVRVPISGRDYAKIHAGNRPSSPDSKVSNFVISTEAQRSGEISVLMLRLGNVFRQTEAQWRNLRFLSRRVARVLGLAHSYFFCFACASASACE
jgi:hypothetical protein